MSQKTLSDYSTGAACPTCGDSFKSEYGVSTHHWQAHGEKLRVELGCDHCGKQLKKRPAEVYDTNFCDSDCMYAYQSGENHPNANQRTEDCLQCGDPVTRCNAHHSDRTFCSHDCYSEWLSDEWTGINSPNATGEMRDCAQCGDEVYRAPYQLDGRNHFCSPECRSAFQKRDTSPASLVTAVRRQLSDKTWTTVAEEYRSGTCEWCGDPPAKQKHDTHHIIPVVSGGCNESELLMEACRTCHEKMELFVRQYPEFVPVLVEP